MRLTERQELAVEINRVGDVRGHVLVEPESNGVVKTAKKSGQRDGF